MWVATMAAGGAAWALIVARGWLVFSLTGSSAWVGVVTFSAMIPQLFVPPIAGFLADRLDRRQILAWVFAIQFLHNIVLAVLAISGVVNVWHVVVLSVINGIVRAVQMPAANALVPNLVPGDKLLNAVALRSATVHASRLVGPLLIAPIMATVGAKWAFPMCAGLYGVGFVLVLVIRTSSTGVIQSGKGNLHNFIAGMDYLYHHPFLLSLTILTTLHCALTMAFESIIPVLSRDTLGAGGAGFTYIMMGVGTGALAIVVVLAGIQSERVRGQLFFWLGMTSGIGPIALALSGNLTTALASAVVMGASQGGFMTMSAVIVQSIVPDGIRGRVTGITMLHIGGMMAIFNLVNGILADVISAQTILTVTGAAFIVVMAASVMRAPLRTFYTAGMSSVAQTQAA